MRMTVASTSVDDTGTKLVATLKTPLPAGAYSMTWRVKNIAGEQGQGSFSFGVR